MIPFSTSYKIHGPVFTANFAISIDSELLRIQPGGHGARI